MKRLIAIILTVLMLVSVCAASASAIAESDWAGLKFTLIRQVSNGYDLAYDDILTKGKACMRGFAITPDGKTMFGGFLNPNGEAAIVMWDNESGQPTGYYQYTPENASTISYPKGLAADDRGYLYAGLARNPNYLSADLAIIKYSETEAPYDYMKNVSVTRVIDTSDSTKTGVNGVAVANLSGDYYCYIIVNYDVDYLYRFKVTDPAAPVLDTGFGNGGRVNLQELEVDGAKLTEGNYLEVDYDGLIYMGYTTGSGAGILTLSDDGKNVLAFAKQTKGYGVCIVDDLVLCSTQSSPSEIVVYKKADLSKVTSFTINENNVVLPYADGNTDFMEFISINSICNVKYAGGCLFFGDQGSTSVADQVLCVSIESKGDSTLKTITDALEAMKAAAKTTEEITTPETPAETTKAEEPVNTEAQGTTAAETTPVTTPETAEVTTEAPAAKKGCGSAFAGAAVIVSILGTALIVRKKY